MAEKSLIVIDSFYDDPEQIREIALSLEYKKKPKAAYPGAEAYSTDYDWEKTRAEIRQYIDEDVDYPCPKTPQFQQGKFRIATAADLVDRPDLVHEDLQRWGGVVYLTLPEHCQGGVAFYRHKATGALSSSLAWYEKVFPGLNSLSRERRIETVLSEFTNPDKWEVIGQIAMQFNRVVILMAHCFHGSTGIFGDSVSNGRLTQHFEFYTVNDR